MSWRNIRAAGEDQEVPQRQQGWGQGWPGAPQQLSRIPALLQGMVVGAVGLCVGGKHWSSWSSCMMESVSTEKKVLKGFSVSCSTLHTLNMLVLGLREKTRELLALTLLMVTSCTSSARPGSKIPQLHVPGQFPRDFLDPNFLGATGGRQDSVQILSVPIQGLHGRFLHFCFQNSRSQVFAVPQPWLRCHLSVRAGEGLHPHGARRAGHALTRAGGPRAGAHLVPSQQHRKRNPPHPKWEEQLSFLFLRCYQELWKVHFKSVLKVPLTISLSTREGLSSRC